ncbi:uncharacterized protein LOC135804822 isoform X2 [Sycon ciliatum]|uniref:uncharacterized protein LOC135804822 isoform X2 n=1 Tax=Sycon ciliatum TaxID=27933 RepID=UPI0031F6682A
MYALTLCLVLCSAVIVSGIRPTVIGTLVCQAPRIRGESPGKRHTIMHGRSDGRLAENEYGESQPNIINVESPASDVQSFSLPLNQYHNGPSGMNKQPTMTAHTPSPSEGLPASKRASSSEDLSNSSAVPVLEPAASPQSSQPLRLLDSGNMESEFIASRQHTTIPVLEPAASPQSSQPSRLLDSGNIESEFIASRQHTTSSGSADSSSNSGSSSSSSSSSGSNTSGSSSSSSTDNESDTRTSDARLHHPRHSTHPSSGHPVHPLHHTHRTHPANPGGYPSNPGHPANPGGYPSNPGHPANPGHPSHPGYPDNPGHPSHPSHPGHPTRHTNPGIHPSHPSIHPGHHTQPSCPGCHVKNEILQIKEKQLGELRNENSVLHEALASCQAALGTQHRVTKLVQEQSNSNGAMLDNAKKNLAELTATMEELQRERDTQTGGNGSQTSQHGSPSLQASPPQLNAGRTKRLPSSAEVRIRTHPYPALRAAYQQLPFALSASTPTRHHLPERISTPPPLQAINYESEDDHSHMYSKVEAVSPPSQARRAPIAMPLSIPSPPAAPRPRLSVVPSATMDYCERVSPVHAIDEVPLEDERELREFAAKFKDRRISLRLTQVQVGQTIGQMGMPDFAQSTISRFEKLTLSYENAMKLRPYIEKWMSLSDHEALSICSPATAAISSSAASGRVNAENNNPAANRSDMDMAQSSVVATAVAPQDLQPAGSIAYQVQPKNFIPVSAATRVYAMPVQAAHDPESHHGQLHRHQQKYQQQKEHQQKEKQHQHHRQQHQQYPHPVHNSRVAAAAHQPVLMEGMHMAASGYSTDYAKAYHQPQNPHSHHAQPSTSNPHPVTYYGSGQGVLTAYGHSALMTPVDIRTPSNSMLMIPALRKRKRRLVLDQDKRKYLEESFRTQPRPSPEDLGRIAHMLNLEKEEVRVWFCNRRQKEKRLTGAGPESRQSAHMDLESYDGNVGGDGAGDVENTQALSGHSYDTHHSPEAHEVGVNEVDLNSNHDIDQDDYYDQLVQVQSPPGGAGQVGVASSGLAQHTHVRNQRHADQLAREIPGAEESHPYGCL